MQMLPKILFFFVLTFSACYRGEVKSLDIVLSRAKQRFETLKKSASKDVTPILTTAIAAMESLSVDSDSKLIAVKVTQVASALDELVYHSNYTVRPAMTELALQYRRIAENKGIPKTKLARSVSVTPSVSAKHEFATIKLLLARTYSLLASELESSRFELAT